MFRVFFYPGRIVIITALSLMSTVVQAQELQHPPYGTDMSLQERSGGGVLGNYLIFKDYKIGTLYDNKGQEFASRDSGS